MLRITLQPRWQISQDGGPALDANTLLQLLAAVQASGSISQGGRELGLSYRHAWGLLQQAEALFGQALLVRGRGRGSALTELGDKLIWADARIGARLQPLLESLAAELEGELGRVRPQTPPVPRLHASHGFAVAALHELLTARRLPIDLRYRNSLEAVAALAQGDCELAGFHVPLGRFERAAAQRYREWLHPGDHALVQLAVRTQGLFVAAGNPLGVRGFSDLARPALRFVNRPADAGTRFLLDGLLQDHGITSQRIRGYEQSEATHAAVAACVASGLADVGFGLERPARYFQLDFMPLVTERYVLVCHRAALDHPVAQALLRLLVDPAFRSGINALPGYDARAAGSVTPWTEAFEGAPT